MQNKRPKIVCELGINFNGDFDLLKRMARTALNAGVDYVKIQTRTPRLCVPRNQWDKPREWFDGEMITYIEYKERMELTRDQLREFATEFEGRWITSVWDEESIGFIANAFGEEWFLYPTYVKIPSAKLTDYSLVNRAFDLDRPVMLSTGMSTQLEVEYALKNLPLTDHKYIIFHCNSSYPTEESEVNLKGIETLKRFMPHSTIGFSSHSVSPYPCIGAMYLGAEFIEVHYTVDRSMQGTDQSASLEISALELLVREAKRVPVIMGDGAIKLYDSEKSARAKLRGS